MSRAAITYLVLVASAMTFFACNPLDVETPRDVQIDHTDNGINPKRSISVAFAIDASSSMLPDSDLVRTKSGAYAMIDLFDGKKDEAAVVWFSQEIGVELELTTDIYQIQSAIDRIPGTGNANRIWDGAYEAIEQVRGGSGYVKAIVLVTDGGEGKPTWSTRSLEYLIDFANQHRVYVYSIALGDYSEEEDLERLSNQTDGAYYKVTNPAASDSLVYVFRDIMTDHLRIVQ